MDSKKQINDGYKTKETEVWDTLRAERVFSVSEAANSTSMPDKSTPDIGKNQSGEIAEQLTLIPYQTMTSSLRDFLVNLSPLLGNEEDLRIVEELCSSRYAELRKLNGLRYCSLRMSKDYLVTKGGKLSDTSSCRWMNWGMTVNGKCLTARISESHRTEKGCSLSDILETDPDPKYFLSGKQAWRIIGLSKEAHPMQLIQTTEKGATPLESQIPEQ